MRILVKLGGSLLDSPEQRHRLTRELAAVSRRAETVVVHGGGKQMTRFLAERGILATGLIGLRFVTHLDVRPEDIETCIGAVQAFAASAGPAASAPRP